MTSRLAKALDELNTEVEAGAEVPNVSYRIAKSHNVSTESLEAAYDEQFERDPRQAWA